MVDWTSATTDLAAADYASAFLPVRHAGTPDVFKELPLTQVATRDANGNMHIGVPTTVDVQYGVRCVLDITSGVSPQLLYHPINANDHRFYMLNNAIATGAGAYTGLFKYRQTGAAATAFWQVAGEFRWQSAAVGTAGNTISWTDSMTLTAAGMLIVGTASAAPGVQIQPAGTIAVGNNAAASGHAFAAFYRTGIGVGSITQSGTTAVLYNTTSDKRLKKNIKDAGDAGALIDAIKVRQFDWKAKGNDRVLFGLVAQELVEIFPGAVKTGDDAEKVEDAWAIDPSKLVPLMLAEIQSLRARLAVLEEKGTN